MILSRSDLERPTCGNRRVPLSGTQFPKLHSRICKATDNELILYLINFPKDLVYAFKKIFAENSPEPRLKYGYLPAQRKQFIDLIPINEKPSY